jgi:hypothetical protein
MSEGTSADRRGSKLEVDDGEKCGFGCTAPIWLRRAASPGSLPSMSIALVKVSNYTCGSDDTREMRTLGRGCSSSRRRRYRCLWAGP